MRANRDASARSRRQRSPDRGVAASSCAWPPSASDAALAEPVGAGSVDTVGTIPPAALALHRRSRAIDARRRQRVRRRRRAGRASTSRDDEQHRQVVAIAARAARRSLAAAVSDDAARRASCRSSCPCARLDSSARFTSSRTAISRSQRVDAASASTQRVERRRAAGTPRGAPTSSRGARQVPPQLVGGDGRIGASSRVSPSAIRYIAVCAERRSGEPAANVYSRSFETSA